MDNFTKLPISHLFSDKLYIKIQYKATFKRKLNLKNPTSFNEKLQWLKLYNRKPEYSTMVDKFEVKDYVASIIGEQYIVPTLGVWDSFDEIDFESLPSKFVLKCTHDSGSVIICRDKSIFDKKSAKLKIEKKLKSNLFWHGREWPYKNVRPRIIAEPLMQDEEGELKDYKIMCFNGVARCAFVCSDRFSEKGLHVTFFDRNWNVMPFERSFPSVKEGLPQPQNYKKMIELSEILSKDIPFVRVDFYEIDGQIYFGELTFFPGNGMEQFQPEEWDYKLGEWIELTEIKMEKVK
ncbi:MAG: glycosyl transferase [Clostridiales bacterium]|nr:glycosyl transferase [Clostridiales bacterium]